MKPIPDMTYNVFGETLNLALSVYHDRLISVQGRVGRGFSVFSCYICFYIGISEQMQQMPVLEFGQVYMFYNIFLVIT